MELAPTDLAKVTGRLLGEIVVGLVLLLLAFVSWRQKVKQGRKHARELAEVILIHKQELAAHSEEAAEAVKLKSASLINLGHELRTPLSGVLGSLELAFMTCLTSQQREYLALTLSSAQRLRSLIDDILAFAEMELDGFIIDHKEFSPEACVRGAVMTFMGQANQKGVSLRTDIAASVPKRIIGDSVRLHQVLVKILDNAIKFSSAGEVVVTLEPSIPPNDVLQLSVRDQGIGIPKEQQEEVFQAFRQGDSLTTRLYPGSGLGLAICKRLVHLMRGTIWLESDVGRGSTVYFTFKYEPVSASSAKLPESQPPANPRRGPSRVQILVVEDNRVNALVTKRLLEARGCYCLEANNGEDAVRIVRTASVNLVLMDLQMPGMDGFEATRLIRESEKRTGAHVPIIALTAHALDSDREKCLKSGMDGYIPKPVERHELYEAIDALLGVDA
jgi:signal transduction histidine kinase/CheY-like chemotaxis protein